MWNKHRLLDLFGDVKEYFSPRIIGEVNGIYVKIAKVKGEAVPWHVHDAEDEMFYVAKGSLVIQVRDRDDITLEEGEFFIVKKGMEHRIRSKEECWLMLVEDKSTKHTGDVQSPITRSIDEQHY